MLDSMVGHCFAPEIHVYLCSVIALRRFEKLTWVVLFNKCSFFKSLKTSLFKVDVSPWSPVEEYTMKPTAVADEMFPEGAGTYVDAEEGGGTVGLLMDLSAVNEKAVHDGFFNDFEDLFDDEDIA